MSASGSTVRRSSCPIVLAALLSLVHAGVYAQAGSASLWGTVSDSSGAPLPAVTISLTASRERVTLTSTSGSFEFPDLVDGTYELTATAANRLMSMRIGRQSHEIVRGPDGADVTVPLGPDRAESRVLIDAEAAAVARLALRAHEHYGVPQDVEWAMDGENLWLVQARPITTLGRSAASTRPLLTGLPAAPGRATGGVRVLQSPSQGAQLEAGDVLVAPMTNPDWLPTIRRALMDARLIGEAA